MPNSGWAMFDGEQSKFWNTDGPDCNDDLYYQDTIETFGGSECSFELGQRSILHALSTMTVQEMLTHKDGNVRSLGEFLREKGIDHV